MKVRMDFVTNSSSSSFLIAVKPLPQFSEEEYEKHENLKELLALPFAVIGKGASRYDTIDDIDKAIANEDFDSADEAVIAECKKYIEQGWSVFSQSLITAYDDPTEFFVSLMGASGLFEIIYDSGY